MAIQANNRIIRFYTKTLSSLKSRGVSFILYLRSNTSYIKPMSFDANTITIRKPLWLALSDLFLDNELQEYNHAHIATAMHESGYSFAEIEDILMLEVFPVCIANLHSVEGEWAGFHEDYVVKTIIKSKRPNRYRRWVNRRNFWMIKKDWDMVVLAYGRLIVG